MFAEAGSNDGEPLLAFFADHTRFQLYPDKNIKRTRSRSVCFFRLIDAICSDCNDITWLALDCNSGEHVYYREIKELGLTLYAACQASAKDIFFGINLFSRVGMTPPIAPFFAESHILAMISGEIEIE